MKRFVSIITLFIIALALAPVTSSAFAADQKPFQFASNQTTETVAVHIATAEKTRTNGEIDQANNTITFNQSKIQLVVRTGPEDDMLSYRIQGLRNPTIIVPENATVKVLFVNVDDDMPHDFRVGRDNPPFSPRPDTSNTEGSDKLKPTANDKFHAQRMSFQMQGKSNLYYFCSVGSHAQKGMWGEIRVEGKADGSHEKHQAMSKMDGKDGMCSMCKMGGMKKDSGDDKTDKKQKYQIPGTSQNKQMSGCCCCCDMSGDGKMMCGM